MWPNITANITSVPAQFAAGSLVVISVSAYGGLTQVSGVNDTAGNSYALACSTENTALGLRSQIWFAFSSAEADGGQLTLGYTSTSPTSPILLITTQAYTGITGPITTLCTSAIGDSGVLLDAGALVADPGALLFGYAAQSPAVMTPPAGFRPILSCRPDVMTADFPPTASSTYTGAFIGDAGGPWSAMLVRFTQPPSSTSDGGADAGSSRDAGAIDGGSWGDAGWRSDGGSATDAGAADAGAGGSDAGHSDAGAGDGGREGGADGGADAGSAGLGDWAPTADLGCGCTAGSGPLLLAAGWLLSLRRRRSRPTA